jgi:hypothetical protein
MLNPNEQHQDLRASHSAGLQESLRTSKSPALPSSYYDFGRYVGRERMLTFWHQLREVLDLHPSDVLEVGVGPRVVTGVLRELGVSVRTADINPELKPDFVGPVQSLSAAVGSQSFDVVLCARVLQHIPFADFEQCVEELSKVTRRALVLTLPVNDFRFYTTLRITARRGWVASVRLPLFVKELVTRLRKSKPTGLWKVDGSPETRLSKLEEVLSEYFVIERSFAVPEDRSHRMFVLHKRGRPNLIGV